MQEPFGRMTIGAVEGDTTPELWCEKCRMNAPEQHMPQDCVDALTTMVQSFLTDSQRKQVEKALKRTHRR